MTGGSGFACSVMRRMHFTGPEAEMIGLRAAYTRGSVVWHAMTATATLHGAAASPVILLYPTVNERSPG